MFSRTALSPTLLNFGDFLAGRPEFGSNRSPKWGRVRDLWVLANPFCAVCGFTKYLNVHHIKPFHEHPELELDPTNFITLGEQCPTGNHHLLFGHLGLWASWNDTVVPDAAKILHQIKSRPLSKAA